MELHCWPGKWGLASFDTTSLAVLTYIRFSNAPVEIVPLTRSEWHVWPSPLEKLPVLRHGNLSITGLENILSHLRKENYGIEYDLSELDLVQLRSISSAVEQMLAPACAALWWLDAKVFTDVTRPTYGYAAGFPASVTLVTRLLRSHSRGIDASCRRWPSEEVSSRTLKNGRRALTMLSYLLGEKDYFLGKRPCAVDAQVFSLLSPLLRAPLPSNSSLLKHLKQCSNLESYCYRIHRLYFSDLGQWQSETLPTGGAGDTATSASSSFSSLSENKETLLKVGAFVTLTGAVVLAYGYMHDILHFDLFWERDSDVG